MQQVLLHERVEYASLGWRVAAVAVDTLVLFGLLILAAMVYILVIAVQGSVDLSDPAAVQALSTDLRIPDWIANVVVFGGLFIYYVVLEAAFSASLGKLVFRMRVTMPDGSRPTAAAILVRNLVRIPEAWLLYVPAGISCLASGRRQRLGDHAARTVVVRRAPATGAVTAAAPGALGAAAWPPAAASATAGPLGAAPPYAGTPPEATPAVAAPPPEPGVGETVAGLKTAALAVRGAHFNYLRFSELELSATPDAESEADYSPGYVSAWYTLADSVAALQKARSAADAAAARAGIALDDACADQPDLVHLFGELEPYFSSESDEQIHEAFLRIARGVSA
jgi:uncharacterized RDD family membrane protein YckC